MRTQILSRQRAVSRAELKDILGEGQPVAFVEAREGHGVDTGMGSLEELVEELGLAVQSMELDGPSPRVTALMAEKWRRVLAVGELGEAALDEALLGAHHEARALESRQCWTVLADESGPGERSKTLYYTYVVIPPGHRPSPELHGFHATDLRKTDVQRVDSVVDHALESRGVVVVNFVLRNWYDRSKTKLHYSERLRLLSATLPLVIEVVARQAQDKEKPLRIYIEQYSDANYEMGRQLSLDLVKIMESFVPISGAPKLYFLDHVRIIEKKDHPWLAYADAVSNALYRAGEGYDDPPQRRKLKKQLSRMRKQDRFFQFDDDVDEFEVVGGLLQARGDCSGVLNRCLEPGVVRIAHEHRALLRPTFANAISGLSRGQLARLLDRLTDALLNEPASYPLVDELLRSLIASDAIGPDSPTAIRASLLNSQMTAANHRGDVDAVAALEQRFDALAPGEVPLREALTSQILRADSRANVFDFEGALERIGSDRLAMASEGSAEWLAASSARAQYHAFLAGPAQHDSLREFARLVTYARSSEDRKRLAVYQAHLCCQLAFEAVDEARVEWAERGAGALTSEGWVDGETIVDECDASPFYRAALCKTWGLGSAKVQPEVLAQVVEDMLAVEPSWPSSTAALWILIGQWSRGAASEREAALVDVVNAGWSQASAVVLRVIGLCQQRALAVMGLAAALDEVSASRAEQSIRRAGGSELEAWLSRRERASREHDRFSELWLALRPLTFGYL